MIMPRIIKGLCHLQKTDNCYCSSCDRKIEDDFAIKGKCWFHVSCFKKEIKQIDEKIKKGLAKCVLKQIMEG